MLLEGVVDDDDLSLNVLRSTLLSPIAIASSILNLTDTLSSGCINLYRDIYGISLIYNDYL